MKKNNKGFTLAELLIVVAIIAVLTAIAIPVFTTQLEKSREAADLANIRSAYAEAMAAAVAGEQANVGNVTVNYVATGGSTYTVTTPPAQSTGAWERVDTDAISEYADLPTSVTQGTAFTVVVTVAADGTATTTISQT